MFHALKQAKKKALIVFVTAGDPSLKKNLELVPVLEKEGVDLIELGVPFSDPLADGPVIQASSLRSLNRKTNLKKILKLVSDIRKKSKIPLVLMSYLNPISSYGVERFAREARSAGVDGVILPELPVEEGKVIAGILRRQKIHTIFLVAPTTSPKRRKKIASASRGFIYYVSITGVTGAKSVIGSSVGRDIINLKKITPLPVCAGFGISTPMQASQMSRAADGVIVGSAIVKAWAANGFMTPQNFVKKYVRPFVRAVKG